MKDGDAFTSTVMIREAGLADCLDTAPRLLRLFDSLVEQKVIPPFTR